MRTFLMGAARIEVLRGVDFALAKGEIVSIVGPSGSGKSTLLHVLGALDRPDEGEVVLDGKDLGRMGDRALAELRNKRLGYVYQFHHLLPELSAQENVLLPALIGGKLGGPGKADGAPTRARELLAAVGLADRAEHRPAELSGGEQQRVAVARALMNRPSVVLADEPAGNLDPEQGRGLFDLLTRFREESGTAFVVVTHNLDLAEAADRRLSLDHGVLTPAEVRV